MPKVKLLLVDEHSVEREGIKWLIQSQSDLELVGEASDSIQAIEQIKARPPDLVLIDASMPPPGGVEATRRLKAASPRARILVLTANEDHGYVRDFLRAGATGYLLKRATMEELLEAIRAVAADHIYVDRRVATPLVNSLLHPQAAPPSSAAELTERESEVLRLVALGYANKEIAARLNLSVKTIETYKSRSMEKLGLKTRVDIMRLGTERGWFKTT